MIAFLFIFVTSIGQTLDPLSQLDQYLAKSTLAQDFTLNQVTYTAHVSCLSETFCDTSRAYQKVTALTENYVEITTFALDGHKISISKLMAGDWASYKGNFVRFMIANKESYGFKITVGDLVKTNATVVVANKPTEIQGYTLRLTGTNGMQNIEDFIFVTNEISGMGQIIEHRWKNSMLPHGSDKVFLEKIEL